MKPSVHLTDLTNVLVVLAGLLDKGQNISTEDLWNQIEQGTLLEFLDKMARKHGVLRESGNHGDFPEYYYNALKVVSEDWPIDVRENGTAVLLAYTAEIIQAGTFTWTACEYAKHMGPPY